MNSICIIGIAGYSGTGKTTLIRKILPELKKQGLSVGVLKHIHHKLSIDIRGKDTDHFYRAGADFVFAHDSKQGFARLRSNDCSLSDLLRKFPSALDLIIIEGHKDMDVPGIWLEAKATSNNSEVAGYGNRKIIYRYDPSYYGKVIAYIRKELKRFHLQRSLLSGLLVGGKSLRMEPSDQEETIEIG